ncbi:hypothetical protein [Burkholderia pseudomallei]|uniref:hypothetical protein n=1 Tax=Burkholderia pseudomallei TaxID=28450 RepID=UPI000A9956DB|nr:hypothetical protein [Burkholderia pseudomallei]MBM5592640.1 hypothetical protein [Burkholderia pseudomallei]
MVPSVFISGIRIAATSQANRIVGQMRETINRRDNSTQIPRRVQFARRARIAPCRRMHARRARPPRCATATASALNVRGHKPIADTNTKNTEGARRACRLRSRALPGAPVAHRVRRAFLLAAVAHARAHAEYRAGNTAARSFVYPLSAGAFANARHRAPAPIDHAGRRDVGWPPRIHMSGCPLRASS